MSTTIPGGPVLVRSETPQDHAAIREINMVAFADEPHSRQTEHLIVQKLRTGGALEESLVAEDDGYVVGHIAFSAAQVGDAVSGWYLLGPVAVRPERQGEGIGRALVEAGVERLRQRDASGCVLVGDPAFYGRFGFRHQPGVTWEGVPDEYVLCLPLNGRPPVGEIRCHEAFLAEPEA